MFPRPVVAVMPSLATVMVVTCVFEWQEARWDRRGWNEVGKPWWRMMAYS